MRYAPNQRRRAAIFAAVARPQTSLLAKLWILSLSAFLVAAFLALSGGHAAGADDVSTDGFTVAAGPIRGVGSLGASPPVQSAPPPRPAYGGTPGDYARGYEGTTPTPDPWHRESDFRDRNYILRHSSPPAYATPSQPPVGGGGGRVIEPYDPILPKPPLPGDSDPAGRVVPEQ